jgi:carbamoylphosphate synthase large subunit
VQVFIIEANPRASRTVPFVAKAIGRPLAAYASLLMSGVTLPEIGFTEEPVLNHVAVKASEAVVLLPAQGAGERRSGLSRQGG